MTSIPVRLTVSERGRISYVLLDASQDEADLSDDRHEALLDALGVEADRLGTGTHVLTVRA